MSVSQLARSICESPTLKLNETAALLRDKGEPVIHLGGGEPKSKTPIDAIVNCTALLNTGDIKYTPADGIPALKKAIIRYTEEHYEQVVGPDNVIASSGAKQSIMVLLYTILDPKDEVIFPAPYWVSYPEMVKLAGGVPVVVTAGRRHLPADRRGDRRGDRLLHQGHHPQQPEQPVGRRLYRRVHRRHGGALREEGPLADHGRHLQPADLRRPRPHELLRVRHKTTPRARKLIVINCVSKMYAMTGFRIGWAVASKEAGPRDDQHPVAADLRPGGAVAVGRRRRAQRRAVLDREPAHDAREQPQRHDGAPAGLRRRRGSPSRTAPSTASPISAPTRRTRRSWPSSCSRRSAWSPCPARSSAWKATCA